MNKTGLVFTSSVSETSDCCTTATKIARRTIRRGVMKGVGLLLASAFAVAVFGGSAQAATYTWIGGPGAAFTTSTNWSPTRTPTANTDVLLFNSGHAETPTSVPSTTIGQLIISNNTSVTLTSFSPGSITLSIGQGVAGTDLDVQSGSSLALVNGDTAFTLNYTSGQTGTTGSIAGTLTVNTGTTWTVNSGTTSTTSVAGTVVNAGAITSTAATLTFASGGKYQHNFANGVSIPTATWNATSTVEIIGALTGTNPPGGLGQSFGNFTWNPVSQTSAVNLAGGLTTVNGNFTVNGTGVSTLTLTGNTALTLNISGSYNQSGGTLVLGNNGANPIVNVSGDLSLTGGTLTLHNNNNNTGTLNVSGNFSNTAGTITVGGNTNTNGQIVFNKIGTQTFTSGGTVSGNVDFTVNSGSTLQMAAAGTIVSGRNFTLSSGATLGITSTAGITSSGATGNIQSTGTRSFGTGANYTYNGSAPQATGNGLPATVNNLTISNTAGAVSAAASVAVAGTMQVDASAMFTPASAVVISGAGTLTGSGTAQVTLATGTNDFLGQYTITNKTLTNLTVEMVGASAQGLATTTFGGLTINNSSGVTLGGGITVGGTLGLANGTFTVGSANTVIMSSGGVFSVGGGTLASGSNGGTISFTGTGTISGTVTFNNLTLAGATNFGAGTIIGGTMTIANSGYSDSGGTAPTYNSGSTLKYSTGGPIATGGEWTLGATSGNGVPVNLQVSTSSTSLNVTGASSRTVSGNVTIDSGTTLSLTLSGGNPTLNVGGDWNNNGGTFTPLGRAVKFNSTTVDQAIQGSAASQTFGALTVTKSAKTLSLSGSTTTLVVSNLLTLTSGTLLIGPSKILTLNGDTSVSSGTLDAANGTVDYFQSTSGQHVIAANYFLLAFNNQNKILPSATIGINDTFSPGTATGHTITSNTIDFLKSSGSQAIPAFNYNNLSNSGNSNRTLASSGTIGIAGTFDPGNGSYLSGIAGSTVEYNGSNAQTMPSSRGFIYNNLSINNSVGVTAPDLSGQTLQINGTLSLKTATWTLNTGNGVHLASGSTIDRSGGSISAAPVFDGTVNVIYSGSSALTTGPEIPTSASVLNNLTQGDSGGVTLGANAQCNGVLTLTNDLTTSIDFTLTQAGTSAGAGDVVGNVHRNDVGGTTRAFGNSNVQVTITAGTITSMDVNLVKGDTPGGFPSAVQRVYAISPGAGTVVAATLRLHYLDSELNGNTESLLTLWRNSTGAWTNQLATSRDGTNNWVELTGVTGFSAWALSSATLAPTAVRLTGFTATTQDDGVMLEWKSGFEVNNLGYNLYRYQDGQRTRVTPSLIAGSSLITKHGRDLSSGFSYGWFDPQGSMGTQYELEAIDLNGDVQTFAPRYAAKHGAHGDSQKSQATLITEVAANGPAATAQNGWAKGANNAAAKPTTQASASALATQQAIAAQQAVKIRVNQSGWYRITQPQLMANGLSSSADARKLQLFVDGVEVPIRLSTNQSTLGSGDTLEFYGVGLDALTTDTHTYYLINGTRNGLRIPTIADKASGKSKNEILAPDFLYTVESKERLIYLPGLLNGDADNIFGHIVSSNPVNQNLSLQNVNAGGTGAQLEVIVQGFTEVDHQVQVQLNGSYVGTINFSGATHKSSTLPVSAALLREGANTVTMTSAGGDADISLVDALRMTYPHNYRADSDSLSFSVGDRSAFVSGFSTAAIRVIDVTALGAPKELTPKITQSNGSYGFTIQTASTVQNLVAFVDNLARQPAALVANQPSSWNASTNAADMVIVTHSDFRASADNLAAARRAQGMRVSVVDVEDVYDEFSFGAHAPQALKDFFAWSNTQWATGPKYALLFGDSSWDPRNYLGQGFSDYVPTKLVDTVEFETASDDWLADFNDDGVSEIALGRLPARTASDASTMVAKILNYEQERASGAALRGALLVSDNGFENQTAQVQSYLSPVTAVQTLNRSAIGNDDTMRTQIVSAIDQGPTIVNYFGHGSVGVWTSAGLLNQDNAATLNNGNRVSLFVMMTCLNGYSHDAFIDSLAETVLKNPQGGAFAVWASSGATEPVGQAQMNTQLYQSLLGNQPMTLGDAVRQAKMATTDFDVRRTWILLGDPAMRLK